MDYPVDNSAQGNDQCMSVQICMHVVWFRNNNGRAAKGSRAGQADRPSDQRGSMI